MDRAGALDDDGVERAVAAAGCSPRPTRGMTSDAVDAQPGSYTRFMAEEHFKDGSLSGKGDFLDGQRSGPWTFYFKNGLVKAEGAYKAGELEGEWVWYREGGGLLQQGAFVDGKQHGRWRRWHSNGNLLDAGDYNAGKKTGEWVTYAKEGRETKRKVFP